MIQQMFKKFERMLYSRAWFYSIAYRIDFEEVQSQAFLIFMEALERFDPLRGTDFSTFLYWRLQTLGDYCKAEKRYESQLLPLDRLERQFETSEYVKQVYQNADDDKLGFEFYHPSKLSKDKIDQKILFGQLVKSLSDDGRILLNGLLNGSFDNLSTLRARNIGKCRIKQKARLLWGWADKRIEGVFDEVRGWWQKNYAILAD